MTENLCRLSVTPICAGSVLIAVTKKQLCLEIYNDTLFRFLGWRISVFAVVTFALIQRECDCCALTALTEHGMAKQVLIPLFVRFVNQV